MKSLFAILAAGGCLLALAATARADEELKVGDQAPEFKLSGTDGKIYTLSGFKGKKAVVIAWYPKAKTGG